MARIKIKNKNYNIKIKMITDFVSIFCNLYFELEKYVHCYASTITHYYAKG